MRVGDRVFRYRTIERGQRDARATGRPAGPGGGGAGPFAHRVGEPARRRDRVDQAPLKCGLGAHALAAGGHDVGEVLADHALVHQPGQPAGTGQHREQRHLGQGHRGAAVVDHDDLVAGQGQLVAAARGVPVDRGQVGLAGVGARLLDLVAGLVGELAEVHLPGMVGLGQHPDVRPGAEHLVQAAGEHDRADLGVARTAAAGPRRAARCPRRGRRSSASARSRGRCRRARRPGAGCARSRRRSPAAGAGNGRVLCRSQRVPSRSLGGVLVPFPLVSTIRWRYVKYLWHVSGSAGRRPARCPRAPLRARRRPGRARPARGRCGRCRARPASRCRR